MQGATPRTENPERDVRGVQASRSPS
jgi:hypothetical protein